MKHLDIRVSDMVAGAIAVLLVVPYVAPRVLTNAERVAFAAVTIVSLVVCWMKTEPERHWIYKVFVYAGVTLLLVMLVSLSFALVPQWMGATP